MMRLSITLPTTKDPRVVAAMNTIAMMKMMIAIMSMKKSLKADTYYSAAQLRNTLQTA